MLASVLTVLRFREACPGRRRGARCVSILYDEQAEIMYVCMYVCMYIASIARAVHALSIVSGVMSRMHTRPYARKTGGGSPPPK